MKRLAVPAWVLALTVLLLWPQRHGGYALGRDLVFTPQQPLNAAAFGVSSAAPRAVPVDGIVGILDHLLGGGVVVGRLALALPLLAAGLGTAALLAKATLPARLLAAGFAVWNPYVVERLALGQWSLLWGYAALAWLLLALCRGRTGLVGVAAVAVPVAAASITPTGGLLAVLVVVVFASVRRRGVGIVLVAVVLQAPWLVAAVLGTAARTSDPTAVSAFAARGEFGGPVVSLLSLGGTWNAAVVPSSREGFGSLATLVVVLLAAVLARRRLTNLLGSRALVTLLVCSGLGLLVAVAASLPGLSQAVAAVVAHVPGGGLLRDAQKWIAPLVLLEALVLGAAADVLWRSANRVVLPLVAVASVAAPLALLPDATSVVWPTVTPVRYPSGFATASRMIDGTVAVLPFQPYRQFSWAGGRPSLDPAPRLLDDDVIAADRLQVGTRLLAGEDPRAARVAAALDAPNPARGLATAGVSWVLDVRGTPGRLTSLAGLQPRYADNDVFLYRVPDVPAVRTSGSWQVVIAGVVLMIWLLFVVASLLLLPVVRRSGSRSPTSR